MTCWEEVKNALINNFFDDKRYLELRNKISTFCQGNREAFKNSCQRLTSYQRECPHHGYPELQPVSIFFRGLGPDYQTHLDVSSDGNFNTRSPEEAKRLIENMISSEGFKRFDIRRQEVVKGDKNEIKVRLDSVQAIHWKEKNSLSHFMELKLPRVKKMMSTLST